MTSSVTLIGNTTRDPELRFTPAGQAVATFGLAVNRRWQNRQTQQWEESASFFDVVCWGSLAENISDTISKGTRVIVSGRLDQRSWETQDGEKRTKVEIVADEVGPSLRWAVAQVTKSDRRNGQGGPQPQGGGFDAQQGPGGFEGSAGDPGSSQGYSPTGSQPQASPSRGYAPAGAYNTDEEPF
ncbi:MAG: single-stranded DNA-binding protein [Chloroflexi bacterium]|nr:single-stranded DNA-binding protein [Chloroflexota bacterium]